MSLGDSASTSCSSSPDKRTERTRGDCGEFVSCISPVRELRRWWACDERALALLRAPARPRPLCPARPLRLSRALCGSGGSACASLVSPNSDPLGAMSADTANVSLCELALLNLGGIVREKRQRNRLNDSCVAAVSAHSCCSLGPCSTAGKALMRAAKSAPTTRDCIINLPVVSALSVLSSCCRSQRRNSAFIPPAAEA